MTWTRHERSTDDGEARQSGRRAFLAGAGGALAGAILLTGDRANALAGTLLQEGGEPSSAAQPATPGKDVSRKGLARGTVSRGGEISVPEGKDVVVDAVSVAPGGEAGWHTHPGDEVLVVTAGELTFLTHDGVACVTEVVSAGQAFLGAKAGQVHTAFNHGAGPVEITVMFVGVPPGEPARIDADKPVGLSC